MKMSEPQRSKLEWQSLWKQAMQIKLYSDVLHAQKWALFIALSSHLRRGDSNFCIRGTPPQDACWKQQGYCLRCYKICWGPKICAFITEIKKEKANKQTNRQTSKRFVWGVFVAGWLKTLDCYPVVGAQLPVEVGWGLFYSCSETKRVQNRQCSYESRFRMSTLLIKTRAQVFTKDYTTETYTDHA